MDARGRRTGPSLEELLFDRGYEFDFFQAVRLLGRVFSDRGAVGGVGRPADEFARFGARLSMAFPASAIHEIERIPDSTDPVRVAVAFFGLTGIQGILPLHYTERLLANRTNRDGAMAAFLDMFNHRLVSLFYRAWEKHRPPVLYEMHHARGRQLDPFTRSLFDLVGMGTAGLRGRMRCADASLLWYAGLIAQRPHSASAIRGILRDYFGPLLRDSGRRAGAADIAIDQFLGGWYALEDSERCYLSADLERNQLGTGAFLGDEVWDQQARFRIRLGPLGLGSFIEFLPDAVATARLVELTRFLVGQAMVFEVNVILRAAEVPFCRLDDEGADAPRLGWMSWLKTDEFTADAADAVTAWLN